MHFFKKGDKVQIIKGGYEGVKGIVTKLSPDNFYIYALWEDTNRVECLPRANVKLVQRVNRKNLPSWW